MKALFIGLTTLDMIFLVDQFPVHNTKIEARNYSLCAGGPATNASVTFQTLGGAAHLLSGVGRNTISNVIHNDLLKQKITHCDLLYHSDAIPAVSSIMVETKTGERTVTYKKSVKSSAMNCFGPTLDVHDFDIILTDGHLIQQSLYYAEKAHKKGIPVILDGGSWKPGLEALLPYMEVVICSKDFFPPGCCSEEETISYLKNYGVEKLAITGGEQPIIVEDRGNSYQIPVAAIFPVDTLGAGDIFHGAFCRSYLKEGFYKSLSMAADVASFSCLFFGTREWIDVLAQVSKLTRKVVEQYGNSICCNGLNYNK